MSINGRFATDSSLSSILLQLDLKEKMILIQGKEINAICNYTNSGPAFGGGHDIYISNNCNLNANSYASFPTSYNCPKKYKTNQECLTAFCGATNGKSFKVTEYEVFQVIL
jgi:hypothetical protein